MAVKGIAHRGDPLNFPENTLSAFQSALDMSFTHLETDVHLSKDGEPVIMHDTTINRMCNSKGRIKDFTLAELKQFKVANTETIPTLEEGLSLLKGRMTIFLELKQFGHLYAGIEEKVIEVIRKLDMADQMIIMSFDHYALIKMRELDPAIAICPIAGSFSPAFFPFLKEIRADYIWMSHRFLTKEYVDDCNNRGIQVIANPVDSESTMNKVLQHYPSALVSTNDLALWKQFYLQHKEQLD